MSSISIAPNDRVFALTGAGVSAESGLPTFRADDGLWAGNRVEDICTPEAWKRDPARVWEFYSARRAAGAKAVPNPAHIALAELEAKLGDRFFLCTQNVDDLHERAGSVRLVHMHGELSKARCERECGRLPIEDRTIYRNLDEVKRCACGGRPASAHRLLRRDSAGDGSHPGGDRPSDPDARGRYFGIRVSGCELRSLGAACRGAHRLRGA